MVSGRKLFIFILIVCLFFCISAVVAGDINNTDVMSSNEDIVNDSDELLSSHSDASSLNNNQDSDVGAKILFTVFGRKIVDITDSSGHAKISTKEYNPGIYNVVFKFAGNSLYSEATSTTKMIVNRA